MNLDSVKAKIRNLSKASGIEANILLTNFMLERLLERVSASQYRTRFILKGGMLVAAMVGVDTRATMDMDATIKYMKVTEESLKEAISEILDVSIDDGVQFRVTRSRRIREDAEYECYRFFMEASLGKMVIPFHIDISTGDILTPKEINYRFKLMFEPREIEISAYNIETVLAEKITAILALGTLGTRMRDYYDVYTLFHLQLENIDVSLLNQAVMQTAQHRNQLDILRDRVKILLEIRQSQIIRHLWLEYCRKYSYAENLSFDKVIDSVDALIKMAMQNDDKENE